MANEIQLGSLRIFARRAGTVAEVVELLQDVEAAYNRIFFFFSYVDLFDKERFFRRSFLWRDLIELGLFPVGFPQFSLPQIDLFVEGILPEHRLKIERIDIKSPGFWEFLGALNPLQQIREYLNDRHKRRQDREYREQAERERLSLENELIRKQIWEKDNSVLRERINILREVGFSNEQIQRLTWVYVSQPLIALGKHQDAGLIDRADSQ